MFRVKNSMKAHTSDWLETVIRFGLIAINQGKEWFIVIENQHELNTIIKTSHQLHASINEELFSIITTSSRYQPGSLVWIKSSGIIQGINAHWALAQGQEWHTADVKDLPLWKQDALLMTVQTDAIVFKALPDWRTFDVIIGGKIFEQVSASQALALMKKHLHYQTLIDQEGITYEPTPSSSLEQRTR